MAQHITLTPADGWTSCGPAATLRLLQVDPLSIDVDGAGVMLTRADSAPAASAVGVVLMGGEAVTEDTVDSVGSGTTVYAKAVASSVRVMADPGPGE